MRENIVKRLTKFLFFRIVGKPTIAQQIRLTFYKVIIMNMFWIDGDLPNNLEQKFEFFINRSWETSSGPKGTSGLKFMSEELLTYLCANLKPPAWVADPNAVKIKMSLNEIVQQWPFLFELPDENPG
jgi:hypothetical protein